MIWFMGLLLVIGIIIGNLATTFWFHRISKGTLRIDKTDPDGPYMFLEIDSNVREIEKDNFVYLRVSVRDSHK